MMKKVFSLIICLFLSASGIAASMEESDGSGIEVTRLKQLERASVLEIQPAGEEGLPEGFNPPPLKALTPAQKLRCCFIACLPFLCVASCFNHVTGWINQGTCGCLYRAWPCLDCTD